MKKFIVIIFVLGTWGGLSLHQNLHERGCVTLQPEWYVGNVQTTHPQRARFIAVGDAGVANELQAQVVESIRKVCAEQGCDFILQLGDNVYPHGIASVKDPQMQEIMAAYETLNLPMYAVLGNHDQKQSSIAQVLYTMEHPLWKMPDFAYELHAGPVKLTGLNTNCHIVGLLPLMNQTANEESASEYPWKFAFAHHPVYGTGTHGDSDSLFQFVWNMMNPDVDVYLTGHNHHLNYLTDPHSRTHFVISGAGSKNYESEAEKSKKQSSVAQSQFDYDGNGFVWFGATPQTLSFEFYDANGQKLYEKLLDSPKPQGL